MVMMTAVIERSNFSSCAYPVHTNCKYSLKLVIDCNRHWVMADGYVGGLVMGVGGE